MSAISRIPDTSKPLLTLYPGEFHQPAVEKRVQQLVIYQSRFEAITEQGKKVSINITGFNLPQDLVSLNVYLKNHFILLKQIGDEYSLSFNARGAGGGAGGSKTEGAESSKRNPNVDLPAHVQQTMNLTDTSGNIFGVNDKGKVKKKYGLDGALIHYVNEYRLPEVKLLLEAGADPNVVRGFRGSTLEDRSAPILMTACTKNDEMALALIEGGAHINSRCLKMLTDVKAISDDTIIMIFSSYLKKGGDPNAQYGNGPISLLEALFKCKRDVPTKRYLITSFLLAGARPNNDLLQLAKSNGWNDIADTLSKAISSPVPSPSGNLEDRRTQIEKDEALVKAVTDADLEAIKVAHAAGGNVNTVRFDIMSLLAYHCHYTKGSEAVRIEIARLLIEKGALVNPTFPDYSPIKGAINSHLWEENLLDFLLKQGAKFKELQHCFYQAFFPCEAVDAKQRQKRIVLKLIEAGAVPSYEQKNVERHFFQQIIQLEWLDLIPVLARKGVNFIGGFRYLLEENQHQATLLPVLMEVKTDINAPFPHGSHQNLNYLQYLCDSYSPLSLISSALQFGADPKLISRQMYRSLSPEVQEVLQIAALKDSGFVKAVENFINKILLDFPGDLFNKVQDANKIDPLKEVIKKSVLDSKVMLGFSEEQNEEVKISRHALMQSLSKELANLLAKKICFDAEKSVFNQDLIESTLQDALTLWKANETKAQTVTQDQQKRQESVLNQQKEALELQKRLAAEQAQRDQALYDQRNAIEAAQKERHKKDQENFTKVKERLDQIRV